MTDENNCGSCMDCDADCGYNGSATVTLELDDDTTLECDVVAIYEASNSRKYIALLPLDENGENDDGEVFIYRFSDASGEPTLDNIDNDEEYETASAGFDAWLESHEFDDIVYEEGADQL